MLEKLKNIFNKKTEGKKDEKQPKTKGKGNYKTNKYSLHKNKGNRYRFSYRFDTKLEFVCNCKQEQEQEVVEYIEGLIAEGYKKEEIILKCKQKLNLKKRGKGKRQKKSSTNVGKMNKELKWKDGVLMYKNKKTNITPEILAMVCTFHSNTNNPYDLIDLINQQYRHNELLPSAVSFICINYNSLNLSKLINESKGGQ